MGVDDDFFTREALLKLVQANRVGVSGSSDDILIVNDHSPMTRAQAFALLTDEAEEAANNIRSAGDSKRDDTSDTTANRTKDRIRLDPAIVDIPGATKTVKHIYGVRGIMRGKVAVDFFERAKAHDMSKLREPEVSGFAAFAEMPPHGTPEYTARLAEMEPVLAEHYAANDHHPEHFEKGVDQMPMPAQIEMLCDWKERAGDKFWESWDYNMERFKVGKQLASVLRATAEYYGF